MAGKKGRSGRKPQPGKANTVKAPDGRPIAPKWLDALELVVWERLVGYLEDMDPSPLSSVDVDKLALACEAWASFFRYRLTLEEQGDYVYSQAGDLKPHPAIKMKNDAIARFDKFAGLFGLSPVDRAGLKLDKVAESERPKLSGMLAERAKAAKASGFGVVG